VERDSVYRGRKARLRMNVRKPQKNRRSSWLMAKEHPPPKSFNGKNYKLGRGLRGQSQLVDS